jgi:geranylgeranyl diphosphate synthase type II
VLNFQVNGYLCTALTSLGGPKRLVDAMAYSLLAPGKRLRPILVLMATEAAGGQRNAGLPAGAAAEMVHTYSLIHDDLPAMDDDDLRRGRPSCHRQFDEALAILAGDALLTGSFQVLADHYPSATAAGCTRELSVGAGAAGMVGGQAEDLAWEGQPSAAIADLESIHARKTGALITACVRMGAFVAQGERSEGPDPRVLAALDRYGRAFGLAFQITDDLLDVESHASEAGKHVGKDATRGKLTYPGLLGIAESRRRAAEAVQSAVDSMAVLGARGESLAALAGYLLDRRQ